MYASRRSPEPLLDIIKNYRPKENPPQGDDWETLFDRVKRHPDDGHAAKLVRALAHGQEVCKPYEDSPRFRIKGDMWLKLGNMGEAWSLDMTFGVSDRYYSY